MPSAFDADISEMNQAEIIRPLWTIKDLDNKEKMLAWQNNAYAGELNRAARYRELAMKHLALYKGRWYEDQTISGKSSFADASQNGLGVVGNRVSKLVVNHLYGLVTQRVSRMTRMKPDVIVEPANSEYGDRVSAKLVKYWIDYLFYTNNMPKILAEVARASYVYGEAYVGTFWDPNAGQVMADWSGEEAAARAAARSPRVMVRDDKGEPVMSAEGEPLYIEQQVKTGDVIFRVLTPLNTLVESCGSFDDADYMFYEDYIDVDVLKALYPEQADKLAATDDGADDGMARWRAVAGATHAPQFGKILVRYFYHRPTQFLAGGRFVMSTRGAVLENRPLPPNQTGLPVARLTDIDVPNEQRGQSFFIQGKAINATINDLSSMIRRNAILTSHPRWLIPRGSLVKKEALGNDITSIEYAGPTPPKIEAPPPMSTEITAIRENLKNDLYSILGVSDIEMGNLPPNVRSALALQAADEQADQRSNNAIVKFNNLIEQTVEKAINLASAYYEKGDKRLVPVVGKNNQYLLKEFDPAHLTKAYDIRVSSASGMPSNKAARTETLLELRKLDPEGRMIPDQQFMEMLEWGQAEKFYDAATIAVKAAEAENEALLNGEEVGEPASFEDHISHWQVHMRDIQNRGFKVSTPPEVQAAMIDHTMATEFLMLMTARKNPAYAINLVKLQQFPAFYELSVQDRILLDRARTGNPLSLVEVDMLYTSGIMPQPGMGAPPPSGGAQGPVNRNDPMYSELTPPGGQPVPEDEQAEAMPPT